jgi:hypothetical protein
MVSPDESTLQMLKISFVPLNPQGGIQCSRGNTFLYGGMLDGRSYQDPRINSLSYELTSVNDGQSLSILTFRDEKLISARSTKLSKDGATLSIAETSWDDSGRLHTEGYLYERAPESDCGIHIDPDPRLAIYGCWVWRDGREKLEHSPEPIVIEEQQRGLRIISPTQSFVLRANGTASVESPRGGPGYSISRWKRQGKVLTLTVSATEAAMSGMLRFALISDDVMTVTVRSTAGRESTYKYKRQ